MEDDPTVTDLQGSSSGWASSIMSGLLDIGKTAVSNLTSQNQTAVPSATTTPASSSWLSKLDAKTVVIGVVAIIAVIFILKKVAK
jgi:hypothetical protein